MKAFTETVAALGPPLFMRPIGSGTGPQALVARWKHADACVQLDAADALRVCLSLRGGHTVRQGRGSRAVDVGGGSVGVFAADTSSEVHIEGQADVVQIFIDPVYLHEAAGTRTIGVSPFDLRDEELQSAALHLFVGACRRGPDDDLLMETSLWRIVEHLVRPRAPISVARPRGGMAFGAMRRIADLVDSRLDAVDVRAPRIEELAGAARMSSSHFIRAFKQSTGSTPHQYVLARRIDRAMGLLARKEYSVADVADSTGYASPSHFVASFGRRLGITPGVYRRAVLS